MKKVARKMFYLSDRVMIGLPTGIAIDVFLVEGRMQNEIE